MRKTTLALMGLAAAALAWGYAQAATETFKGTLSAATEVPPVTSAGTGDATAGRRAMVSGNTMAMKDTAEVAFSAPHVVTLDTATKVIIYTVTYSGLSGDAAAAHIHCGAAAGANAGVAVPFPTPKSPIAGSATLTDAQMADLEAGKCYVNIHTAANKSGELRAQLTK